MRVLIRVGTSFACLLLSAACLGLLIGASVVLRTPGACATLAPCFLNSSYFGILVTIWWALPAWCLFLPVAIAFKDAEERRVWVIFSIGILVGPVSLVLWQMVAQRACGNSYGNSYMTCLFHSLTDPPVMLFLVLALIVGSLTTCLYVLALKILHKCVRRGESD